MCINLITLIVQKRYHHKVPYKTVALKGLLLLGFFALLTFLRLFHFQRKKEEEAKKILILKGKIKKNMDNLEEFVKDTPEIGTDKSLTGQGYYPGDRLTYLRYHEMLTRTTLTSKKFLI